MDSTADIGIFTTDTALVVRTWDGWLEAATAIPRDAAIGRPLSELRPELGAPGFIQRLHDVLTSGTVQVLSPALHHFLIACPPRLPSARFDRMQQRVTIGPLQDGAAIVGVVVAIEDVTARIDAERDLAEALESPDPARRREAADAIAAAERIESPTAFVPALAADNWRVRQAAVQALASSVDQAFIENLIASLRQDHRNFALLGSTLKLLAATHVDIVSPLSALLKDADPDLRIQAALALGDQPGATAVAPLIEALRDPEVNVRFQAIESLGRLHAEAAVDELMTIVESGDQFLTFAALDALAAIGEPRIGPRLVALLSVASLRVPVVDALGALGDEEVVLPLVTALNASDGAVASTAGALVRIHDRFEREYRDGARIADLVSAALTASGAQHVVCAVAGAGDEQLPALARLLGWCSGPDIPETLTRLLGEPSVRADVIEALVRHGDRVVDLLIGQLGSEDPDTRHASVVALGRLGSRRATAALVKALDGESDLLVAIAGALARISDPGAFEPLLSLLDHPDASVRQSAIGALNSMGHPELPARVGSLLEDANPVVRESAVRIAGYFGYPQTLDRLFDRVEDGTEAVRRAALEHLPFLDDPRVLPALLRAIDDDSSPVRASAARALARITGPEAAAALLRALDDDDAWVRYFAARSITEHDPGEDAVIALIQRAQADAAPQVRIAAIDAIGAVRVRTAIPALKELASDANDEVAAAALGALGRIAEADGLPELIEAVRADTPSRRTAAVRALASHGTAEAVSSLEWTAAADPEPAVARAAIDALASVAAGDGPGAGAATDALLTLLSDTGRRELAATAIAGLPAARVTDLSRGLRHPQSDVRTGTVDVLGRLQRKEASQLIITALHDSAPEVREMAVATLSRLGARGMEATFAGLAAQDPSKAVRRAATAALARLRA